jgi:hypothetical protein
VVELVNRPPLMVTVNTLCLDGLKVSSSVWSSACFSSLVLANKSGGAEKKMFVLDKHA